MDDGRILAIDVGTHRTGVAISDESLSFAFPLATIETQDRKTKIRQIAALLEERADVDRILIGIPYNQEGEVSQMGKEIRRFGNQLKKSLNMPIIEWDESYTSAQAERALIEGEVSRQKRKKVIDKLAASILLQSYLDSLKCSQDPLTDFSDE